jgi:hypothetical protein
MLLKTSKLSLLDLVLFIKSILNTWLELFSKTIKTPYILILVSELILTPL